MRKYILFLSIIFILGGCTQIITTPISVAGSVAGAAIDVTSATLHAVTGSDED